MRIDRLYVERAAEQWPATNEIICKLQPRETISIEDYQDLFSRRKTDYLEKRNSRNVFIAVKRGAMVKEAPPAYGYGQSDLHYYYVHAYNCVYECEYCYLQGYFSSPDLVFFVNHDDALAEMQQIAAQHSGQNRVWFHAGEFSDSLALSHISGELPYYWKFFQENPETWLELRTKSVNLSVLRSLEPLPNVVVSFSLATEPQAAAYDRETPSVKQRLSAMQRLRDMGFRLGVHFDPIIYADDFAEQMQQIASQIRESVGYGALEYISVGAVRFAKDVFREARANYPDSQMFARHFIQGTDTKMRYIRPLRLHLIETARAMLKKHGCPEEKIYICME
ncbi:MAG: SPL family radical SAM protein [Spirochaetota bacterium]